MRTNQIRCSRYHRLPGNAGVSMTKRHRRCGASDTSRSRSREAAPYHRTATALIISVIRISSGYRFVTVDGADSRCHCTVGNRTEDL
ncbi:hypothetical protein QE152_g32369 [Popillia japonica]|uniref:Uncharacterized protein n=1 Tax=Popillia japonica TaxID=7064 RepID=A0AAW1IZU3_POPJA